MRDRRYAADDDDGAPASAPAALSEPRVRHASLEREETDTQSRSRLVVLTGMHAGHMFFCPVAGMRVHIGRSKHADVQLRDPSVRSVHAVLERCGEEFLLSAVDSRTLLVNGVRLRRDTLFPGDVIALGSVMLRFVSGGTTSAIEPELTHATTPQWIVALDCALGRFPGRAWREGIIDRARDWPWLQHAGRAFARTLGTFARRMMKKSRETRRYVLRRVRGPRQRDSYGAKTTDRAGIESARTD